MFDSVTVTVVGSREPDSGSPTRREDQVHEAIAQGMEVGLCSKLVSREAGSPGLGQIDVKGDLAQPSLDHQATQEMGKLEQTLAVGHQHRDQADIDRMTNQCDQVFRPSGPEVGIDHVPSRDLQVASGAEPAAIGLDLFLHLRQRGHRNPVRVGRQVAVAAAQRAIGSAQGVPAVRVMSSHHLPTRAQVDRKLPPALGQKTLRLGWDRMSNGVEPFLDGHALPYASSYRYG